MLKKVDKIHADIVLICMMQTTSVPEILLPNPVKWTYK